MTDHTLITNYYIAHRDELLAYACSRLGDSCQAEDIVQNVFLRLLTSNDLRGHLAGSGFCYDTPSNL